MKRLILFLAVCFIPCIMFAGSVFMGTWNGKIAVGEQTLTLVVHFSENDNGEIVCYMDSPDQGAKGIPVNIDEIGEYSVKFSVPSAGINYSGTFVGNAVLGTFCQWGQSFTLNLVRGEAKVNRPQTPLPPFPYTEEEVSFCNEKAGITLSGTLVLPHGADTSTPVVIMISGSGLQNRDEEVFEHKPFLVIADYLARQGIASLRYDDRGFGSSEVGDIKEATTKDFMEDAAAGTEFLRSSGRFCRVGAIGHSEGASIAFMLASRGMVDFVVSLAGIGVKGDRALTAQTNKILEYYGQNEETSVEDYRRTAVSSGNKWLMWFIDYDPTEDISGVRCPVFAANGDKDMQVISSLNINAIKEALPFDEKNLVKEYPGLNHLFQHCTSGSPNEYRSIEETFSWEVLSDMASWILSL